MDNLLKAVYQQFMYVASIYYQYLYSTSAVYIHCKYFHWQKYNLLLFTNFECTSALFLAFKPSTCYFLLLTSKANFSNMCLLFTCHSKLQYKHCRSLLDQARCRMVPLVQFTVVYRTFRYLHIYYNLTIYICSVQHSPEQFCQFSNIQFLFKCPIG